MVVNWRQEPGTFGSVLEHAQHGLAHKHYSLAVTSFAQGSKPKLFPIPPREIELADYLRSVGLAAQAYRVELVRTTGSATTRSRTMATLKRAGPLTTVVKLGGTAEPDPDVDAEDEQPVPKKGKQPPPQQSRPDFRIEVDRRRAEVEGLELEVRKRRVLRELDSMDGGGAQKGELAQLKAQLERLLEDRSRPGVLEQLAPVITPAIAAIATAMLQGNQRRDELLTKVLFDRGEPAPEAPSPTAWLGPVREVLALAKELAPSGGDGDRGTLGAVADIVNAILPRLPAQTGEPQHGAIMGAPRPRVAGAPSSPGKEADSVNLHVAQWLRGVYAFAKRDADPIAVAERMHPNFGLLSGEFRALVLGSGSVEALVSGLVRWLPAPAHVELSGAIATSEKMRAWLSTFVEELVELESPEQESEDAGDEQTEGDEQETGAGDADENGEHVAEGAHANSVPPREFTAGGTRRPPPPRL